MNAFANFKSYKSVSNVSSFDNGIKKSNTGMTTNEPDIYAGFQTNTTDLYDYEQHDEAFQNALKVSSYGKKIATPKYDSNRTETASRLLRSSDNRQIGRPTTAIQPVGYTSEAGRTFDPFLYQRTGTGMPGGPSTGVGKKSIVVADSTVKKPIEITEEKYKGLENKINFLLEESILESTTPQQSDLTSALNKAKEASVLDRTLLRLRDQNSSSGGSGGGGGGGVGGGNGSSGGGGGTSFHNFDTSFLVLFNLANIYEKNKMYVEALNTYALMTKNKMYQNVNRLKINMGNIYFQLGVYPKAIKMYRMALDQVPSNQKELRLKISHNIGIVFIKMGQYSDAAANFEFIMSERADLKCGLHLILCYYALGDASKIKHAFQLLLDVQFVLDADESHKISTNIAAAVSSSTSSAAAAATAATTVAAVTGSSSSSSHHQYIMDVLKNDEMSVYEKNRKHLAEKNILMSANLIASVIEEDFNEGYTWCVEIIKNSSYPALANELELNKAIMYLKQHEVQQAIETLKYYEKKEPAIAVNAVINLTFIYTQMRDWTNAKNYAQICRRMDSYNPATYVNSGVYEMLNDNLEQAKSYFEQALEIDTMCFEGIYNLGLVCKKFSDFQTALVYFRKVHAMATHSHHPHVIYQMANLYELIGDTSGALEWYIQLLGSIHMDPGIFQKIAEMSEAEGDRQQAYQYQAESFRTYPSNLQTISWLGSHYIDLQVAEKAILYYEKAVLVNPKDPYFLLRIAGCFRRIGNSQKSLQMFQNILKQFPENVDCYRALIHLTQTLNMDELYQKYLSEFQRLEKLKETRQRIGSSRPTTTTGGQNNLNSASSSSRKRLSGRSSRLSNGGGGGGGGGIGGGSIEENVTPTNSLNGGRFKESNSGEGLTSYSDPLGPPTERPRTGKMHSSFKEESDEDFDADEMLPL